MKKRTESYTVELHGVELTVEGYWDGVYIAETREQPAEFPEFNIENVRATGCMVELLTNKHLEAIYEKII